MNSPERSSLAEEALGRRHKSSSPPATRGLCRCSVVEYWYKKQLFFFDKNFITQLFFRGLYYTANWPIEQISYALGIGLKVGLEFWTCGDRNFVPGLSCHLNRPNQATQPFFFCVYPQNKTKQNKKHYKINIFFFIVCRTTSVFERSWRRS